MPDVWKVIERGRNLACEVAYGISTRGVEGVHTEHQYHYATVSYGLIEATLDAMGVGPGAVVLDVGCGRGRVLCCAARRPVAEVVGLELDPERARAAEANAEALRGRKAPVRVVVGDAMAYEFSNETAVYMFNPFGEEVMVAMMANLERSLDANPRPLSIGYVYPRFDHVVRASGRFEITTTILAGHRGADHDVTIYRCR